jgi:protein-S-isoprenylcysteine O-methyltransferase Ste14
VGTRIPPPVYALLTAAAMWLLDRYSPHCRFGGVPWIIAGCGCTALGIGLPLTAMVVFYGIARPSIPMRPDRASRLIVSGIYRISRNPMYLGWYYPGRLGAIAR